MKSMLGITPSGVLCFVSDLLPGSTSDKEKTVLSVFLEKLNHGDQVMADKGFNCQDELAFVGASQEGGVNFDCAAMRLRAR